MTQGFEVTPASQMPHNSGADYQIKHFPEGVVVYTNGGIPVSAMTSLGKLVPGPDAKKMIALSLSAYYAKVLGARVIYPIAENADTLKTWEKRVEEEIAAMRGLSVLERWEIGFDTGTSAKTMVQAAFPDQNITRDFGIPHDPDDFGRCMRTVDYFTSAMGTEDPEIRKRFLDPANYKGKGQQWPAILERWDELCALGRQAGLSKRWGKFSKPHAEELYQALQQIERSAL